MGEAENTTLRVKKTREQRLEVNMKKSGQSLHSSLVPTQQRNKKLKCCATSSDGVSATDDAV